MENSTQELIHSFIENHFSEEMQDEVRASFMLLEAFNSTEVSERLEDILYDGNYDDTDQIEQNFLECIDHYLDILLEKHQVVLKDTSLEAKNQIIAVLYQLQRLEDPVPPLRILETDLSNEEKFSKIVSSYSELDEVDVLDYLESVAQPTLDRLQDFLYQQEEDIQNRTSLIEPKTEKEMLIRNLRDFFTLHGTESLGYSMIESGIEPGYSFSTYYSFVKKHLIGSNDASTAKNILGLLFLAMDTWNEPLESYRKYSEEILETTDRTMKVEVELTNLLNRLREYQKAKDEERRVSTV